MSDLEMLKNMLPVLIPIVIFQIGFQVYCIINLVKQEKVKFNNKILWAIIILFFNLLGGIIYLAIGRENE